MTARIRQTVSLVLDVDPGHIQEAVNAIVYDYDFACGASATVQLKADEYHDQVTIASEIAPHVLTIRGASSVHPEYTLWAVSGSTAQTLVSATDGGRAVLADLELGSYVAGSTLLAAFQEGTFDVENVMIGSCEGGVAFKTGRGGKINFTGPVMLYGNAATIAQAQGGTIEMSTVPINLCASICFDQFVAVDFGGAINRANGFSGIPAGGKQYTVGPGGILRSNGIQLPGNLAGTNDRGVVY